MGRLAHGELVFVCLSPLRKPVKEHFLIFFHSLVFVLQYPSSFAPLLSAHYVTHQWHHQHHRPKWKPDNWSYGLGAALLFISLLWQSHLVWRRPGQRWSHVPSALIFPLLSMSERRLSTPLICDMWSHCLLVVSVRRTNYPLIVVQELRWGVIESSCLGVEPLGCLHCLFTLTLSPLEINPCLWTDGPGFNPQPV